MTDVTIVLVVLAAGTYLLKAAGPVLLGGSRELPWWLDRLAMLLPAALLAALVVTSTFADGDELVLDARVVGVAVTAVALKLRAPFVVAIVLAAAATALTRLVVS